MRVVTTSPSRGGDLWREDGRMMCWVFLVCERKNKGKVDLWVFGDVFIFIFIFLFFVGVL